MNRMQQNSTTRSVDTMTWHERAQYYTLMSQACKAKGRAFDSRYWMVFAKQARRNAAAAK
jgi:hypothetical protein